jgi:hypothetical protein
VNTCTGLGIFKEACSHWQAENGVTFEPSTQSRKPSEFKQVYCEQQKIELPPPYPRAQVKKLTVAADLGDSETEEIIVNIDFDFPSLLSKPKVRQLVEKSKFPLLEADRSPVRKDPWTLDDIKGLQQVPGYLLPERESVSSSKAALGIAVDDFSLGNYMSIMNYTPHRPRHPATMMTTTQRPQGVFTVDTQTT